MSIQEHLNKIRNAVYGYEVRESIAKGIETAYDDASEKDNANMEVKIARGTHPNLRSRLEEVDNKQQQNTAQLQQTEQELSSQLAHMEYSKADKNYVDNTKRDKSVKVEPEDVSERFMGLITGDGTINLESIPQNGSVGLDKLDQSSFIGFIETNYEQGDIGSGGKNANSDHRIRSGFFCGNTQTKIVAEEGVRFYVWYYNSKDTNDSINGVGWKTGEYILERDSYVRILALYSADYGGGDPLVFTTVEDLASKVTIQTVKPMTDINNLMNRQDEIIEQTESVRLDWILGTIGTNTHDYENSVTRIMTPKYTKMPKGATVELPSGKGFRFSVNTYTDKDPETHVLDTGWIIEKYVMTNECYARFVVSKSDNTEITEPEIDVIDDIFAAYVPVPDSLKYVKDEIDELVNATGTPTNVPTNAELLLSRIGLKRVAHRGYSDVAPENTIPAVVEAGNANFWGCECDAVKSSDGVWFVMHDDTVDRTTNGTGLVSGMTSTQIKELIVDVGPNIENYPNLKVPTVKEYLLACKKHNLVPIIHVDSGSVVDATLVNDVIACGLINKTIFITYYQNKIEFLKSVDSRVITQILTTNGETTEAQIKAKIDYIATVKNNAGIGVLYNHLTQSIIDYAHTKNVVVSTFTLNDETKANELENYGLDMLTTDSLI